MEKNEASEPGLDHLRLVGTKVDSKIVRSLREELGMTQKEFAEYLGLSAGTVATWERRSTLSSTASVLLGEVDRKTLKYRQERQKLIAAGFRGSSTEDH